jgi:glycosyltransferase involved in cell wall biosynthesis
MPRMKTILMYSPRAWNLLAGQEKDFIAILNKKYEIIFLDFLDYSNLKEKYPAPENTKIIIRKTNLKPGILFGMVFEFKNLFDSFKFKHDIAITYLTAGSLFAVIGERLRGKKVLLIYADDMPELHKKSSYISYLVTKYFFNPLSCFFANEIVVTAKLLEDDIKVFNKRIEYIPNGVSFKSYTANDVVAKKKKEGVFTIGFVGGFGKWVHFGLILDYAEKHPETDVVLVGDGEVFAAVKKRASKLKNVRLTGMVDKTRVREEVINMDVCLIPFYIERLTDRVCPIKLFEYWALKKPVVSTRFFEITTIGKDIVQFADTVEELEKVLENLKKNTIYREKLGLKGFEKAKEYDWEKLGQQYLKLLKKMEK